MLFVIPKIFRIFVVPMGLHPPADIFIDESVLAFILERKCGSFQEHKVSNALVTPYCIVFGALYPVLIRYECGVCLFVFGSFHNLRSDRLISSTLSFFINISI